MPHPAELEKRSRASTRAWLLESAKGVLAEKGFQAASVGDLCAAAGFTRGAFYSNFASKDELFLALWDEQADAIVAMIAVALDAIAAAAVPLDTALDLLADHELYDGDWFALNTEFILHALRNPDAAGQLSRHRARLRDELSELIATLLAAADLRPPPGVDVDALTRLVIAGHEGCQNQTRIETDIPGPNLFRTYLEVVITSCRSA